MIRDLTKAMLSFSWAMSLFGAKQALNILTPQSPGQPTHKATAAFDTVTQAAEAQLDDTLRGAFKVGDQLQKGMVDLASGFFTLEVFNPSWVMKMTSSMMQQASDAFRQSMPEGSAGTPQGSSGWGPVPPAN